MILEESIAVTAPGNTRALAIKVKPVSLCHFPQHVLNE
jgi:hypothetical protein